MQKALTPQLWCSILEVCVGGAEAAGGSVVVVKAGDEGGTMVIEGFVSEEKAFELNLSHVVVCVCG